MDTVGKTISGWKPISSEETISVIRKRADDAGITFHVAPSPRIPYSLNLFQDDTGRVLMTSGEEELESLVKEIVGNREVFKTQVPIRFFPAWNYAGIRCLINDAPIPLLIKKN